MFNNNIAFDFSDVKYEDVKVEIKSLFTKAFNFESFLMSFLSQLTIIVQIYYFSSYDNFYSKLYIFSICCVYFKILSVITTYFQTYLSELLSQYFIEKKYYEMGDVFKKSIVMTEIINVIVYYPLKWFVLDIFLTKVLTQKLNYSVENDLSTYGKEKINQFLFMNFFVLLISTVGNLLCDVLMTFEAKMIINLNSVLKFVINVFFCKWFGKKSNQYLFVKGICYANIISEGVSLLFVFLTQKIKNPYPQAWTQFNLQLFTGQSFKSLLGSFDIFNFASFIILFLYEDIFLVLFALTSITSDKEKSIENYILFFGMLLIKNLLFKLKQKDKEEILSYYHSLSDTGNGDSLYNKLSYEYDSTNQRNKNYEWILFIKTKIIGTIAINLVIAIIYLIFYFFNGFSLIKINESNMLANIFLSVNALVQQTALVVLNLFECLLKRSTLTYLGLGFGLSIAGYFLVFLIFSKSLAFTVLLMYITFYVIYIRFLPQVKNVDMRVVNFEMINSEPRPSL